MSATSLVNTDIHVAQGVEITDRQRQLVGCVLDLFQVLAASTCLDPSLSTLRRAAPVGD